MPSQRPAEIVFLRHGESLANINELKVAQGLLDRYPKALLNVRDADIRLTERGVAQAQVTGRYLAEQFGPFDYCYVSPWARTRETFEHVLDGYPDGDREQMLRCTRYDERVREREMGVLNWLTREEIAERYPDQTRRREIDGEYFYRPSGGESWADVSQRLGETLTDMYRDRPGCRLLVVAHAVVVLCFRKLIQRLDEEEILRINRENGPRNCSINLYAYDPHAGEDGKLALKEWNHVAYGPEFASVVPDQQQRQPRPGE